MEDTGGNSAGAAYIYERDGAGGWNQVSIFHEGTTWCCMEVGHSVALSGDTALVGAPKDDWPATDAGAAHVIERDANGNWNKTAILRASDAAASDYFGWSVSISGDYAIVGAKWEDTFGSSAGAAYVFERDAGTGVWSEVQILHASNASSSDYFGNSVSVSGDYAIVGAYSAPPGGAAYVFERDGLGAWNEAAILTASDAYSTDQFGWSVSVSGGYAIVGAKEANWSSYGGKGAAYIFERDGLGAWNEVALFDGNIYYAQLGTSVSISGDTAIAGAPNYYSSTNQYGHARVFNRGATGTWSYVKNLQASDFGSGDRFGQSVAIDGATALVGAKQEDAGGSNAGSSYFIELPAPRFEAAALNASDAQAGDQLGGSVSVSGAYAVAGAAWEDGGAGDPLADSGSAYVYKSDGLDAWAESAILSASDAQAGDNFGSSVAVSGAKAVVGATGEDTRGSGAGAAYVFERDGADAWTEEAILHASDGQAADNFGAAITLRGTAAAVGAPGESGGAGAVYVYEENRYGVWKESAILRASDAAASDGFGTSVSMSGAYLIVGAKGEDTGGAEAGAAYLFERDGIGGWTEAAILKASDVQAGDQFGVAVSISGHRALVGASLEDTGGADAGAVYVFESDGAGTWSQTAILYASDAQPGDKYGISLSLNGNRAIVGASGEDSGGSNAGAAYTYMLDSLGTWIEATYPMASDAQASDNYGASVSISGATAIVGAYREDGGSGDPAANAGAVYLLEQ